MQSQHTFPQKASHASSELAANYYAVKLQKKCKGRNKTRKKKTIAYPFFDFLRVFTNNVTVITASG